MRQGTTPIHTFTLPFDTGTVQKARVIYAQGGDPKIIKTDVGMDGNTISVQLSQEDTLKLDCNERVYIQLHILTQAGDSLVSPVFTKFVRELLYREVLA